VPPVPPGHGKPGENEALLMKMAKNLLTS